MGAQSAQTTCQGVFQEDQITFQLHHSSVYYVWESMGRKSRRTEAGIAQWLLNVNTKCISDILILTYEEKQ